MITFEKADLSRANSRRCRRLFWLHLSASRETETHDAAHRLSPRTHQVTEMVAAEKG